jgi:hypothetical protein
MRALVGAAVVVAVCCSGTARADDVPWRPAAPEAWTVKLGVPEAVRVDPGVIQASQEFASIPGPLSPGCSQAPALPDGPAHEPPPPEETWERSAAVPPGYEPADFGGLPAELVLHHPTRIYGSGEYMLWWFKGDRLPALVTTGPDEPPTSTDIARLGESTTRVLIGDGTLDQAARSGYRFTFGYWWDDQHSLGIEAGFFAFPRRTRQEIVSSDTFPVLARPFFRVNPGPNFGESSEVAARPGQSTGSIRVGTSNELWGVEAMCRHCLWDGCGCDCFTWHVDGLCGVRYLDLNEELQILEALDVTQAKASPALPNGGKAFVFDRFRTHDQFYGGQIGLAGEVAYGRWSLGGTAKVALGVTHEVVIIDGNQLQIDNVLGPQRFVGGLLALDTNSGHRDRERFAAVPEVGLNVGYRVTDNLRLTLGYNFLYWSNVVRPADQIDRNLDVTRIPNFVTKDMPTGLIRPAPLFQSTDFWAQGLSVGVEVRW